MQVLTHVDKDKLDAQQKHVNVKVRPAYNEVL